MSYTNLHTFDETVVDRINKYLKDNKMSVQDVSNLMGMSYNRVYQMLRKNQLIKLREYIKLCNALRVSFDTFITDVDTDD